jgi:hypothetical protein
VKLIPILIAAAFIGGWIYLLKYVRTKAGEQTAEGEEFRTGRPPTWRIVLYCLIAVAIPIYFTYPDFNKLQPQIKILLLGAILILPAFIFLIGVILPAIAKKKKSWLTEYKKLILYIFYIALAISISLKLWDIFHNTSVRFRSQVNIDDFRCLAMVKWVEVEQALVKRAFSQTA